MSLKILHVLDHSIPLHSGYSFRTLGILEAQRQLGWQTLHLTSSKHYGAELAEETVDNWHFFRTLPREGLLDSVPVLSQLNVIRDTRRRLSEVIVATKPDIVHAHSPCLNGIAALWAARSLKIPVVYEMRAAWEDAAVDHGTTQEGSARYRLTRALETWTLKHADEVTTICEGLRQDIVSRGIPPGKVTVIPNAVDAELFPVITEPDRALRRDLGLDDAFVVGFVGSFYAYEGLDTLIAALPGIAAVLPSARLLLVGGGSEEDRLKAQAARLGIADRIVFTGRVAHRDVARYYGLIDLLAYPRKSMRLTETVTPLKPLEAMAQGRLLIASNVGGHRELIADGQTGYLFEPNNPDALARAVGRVLANRDKWDETRRAGRHFVETERSWRTSAGRYADVYRRARATAL